MSEDSPTPRLPTSPGDVVAGKYRVERVIGTGGMGVVVAAMQIELDRRVALKFLLPEASRDADVVARFAREARAAAKIHGEHVARVLDVGQLGPGQPYLVMEYLEGTDLAQRIADAGRLALEEVAGYVIEACEALAEAHAAGVVHRDLKPANLFLAARPDGSRIVKLLDFGISKAPVGAAGGVTSTQAIMGSPVYMSPEQLVSAKQVDARADLWSLGVVLYEALAGRLPFEADSMPQIVTRILHAPAPPLAASRPDLPPPACDAVARCLEKDPLRRFSSVADLARALAPFVPDGARSTERIARLLQRGASVPSSPRPLAGPAWAPKPTEAAWGTTNAHAPVRRSRVGPWIVGLTLGACFVVGAGALAVQRARHVESVASPASMVVPGASASDVGSTAVTLAPPSSAAAVGAAAIASGPPEATLALPRQHPGSARSRGATNAASQLAAGAPSGATSAVPAPAPPPASEPPDPLHMGIK
jgi:serine/threonine-protein kinase